jgi:NADP-dependent 3-hydroxy acid dehydrogenase YdfG
MPSTELKGKVAWVTGGGSGIGLAGAKALAAAGAHVVISGRTARTHESGLAELKKLGSAEANLLDVGDRAAVEKTAAEIEKRHGRIDILVTSAGTNIGGGKRNLASMNLDGWDDVVRINLNGLFYCCYAVLPGMRARKDGLIINISSIAGLRASLLGGVAYSASKFAMTVLGTCVGLEEKDRGIRVTNVYPCEVETPILDNRPQPVSAEHRARILQPEDIASLVVAVASLPPRAHVPDLVIKPTTQAHA